MSDEATKTLTATFETRAAADLAIEHLVQEAGIDRSDIFVKAAGMNNSSGLKADGSDNASPDGPGRFDGAIGGEIEVSADVRMDRVPALNRIFGDTGALRVTSR
jgi:hypothetical protein